MRGCARRGPVFQDVGLLTYSDDGAHFAYVAQRQKHGPWSALVDGRSIGEWDTVESLSFGPDGRHLTLTAHKEGEASRVWIDGKAGPSTMAFLLRGGLKLTVDKNVKPEDVRLDMEGPVKPDAQGNYPVPMPGLTEFKI